MSDEDIVSDANISTMPLNDASQQADEGELVASQSVPDADLLTKNDLDNARNVWRQLLAQPLQAGDLVAVMAVAVVDGAFAAPVSSVAELAGEIGKVDNTAIVDQNGNLFPEGSELVPTTYVVPELYNELAKSLGVVGEPVMRVMVADQDGSLVLERYAPYFIIHTLSKGSVASRGNLHSKTAFSLSQTKTFRELMEVIQAHLFKNRPSTIRVWFITTENVEDLPSIIPTSVFINKVQYKKLVVPKVMNLTLQSQGIRSSRLHLVVEVMDKTTKRYPVDMALATTDLDSLDLKSVTTTGGNLGLSNLGNTCYMNSALQCLVHLPEINYYFFFDLYEKELNRSNPLGNKGEVAVAFSNLLHKLFDVGISTSYVTPREFKYTIGRYSSMFHGYQQQDSQEFLSWLLDALHEDLNRIQNKPYCEKPELKDEDVNNPQAVVDLANQCWQQHKLRNDSIIVDLFTGLYQSTLVCPTCDKKSITFDPFNDLTLPLPVNKKWYHEFTIVDLSGKYTDLPISKLEVELTKSSNFDDLLAYLSSFLKAPKEELFLFEIFRNFFYKNFQDFRSNSKFLPITELITDGDTVLVYIIPHNPEADIIVPVINVTQDEDKSYNIREAFGIPLFVVLDKETESNSFGTVRQKVEQAVKILSRVDLESKYSEIKGESHQRYYSAKDFPLLNKPESEDTVMVGDSTDSPGIATTSVSESSDDGYDSDISLAQPHLGASFGFEIKYYEETLTKHSQFRGMGSRFAHNSTPAGQSSFVSIPHSRPQFDSLPSLASKLPKLKRDYYHYPDYVANLKLKEKETEDEGVSDENEYVLVDRANEITPDDTNSDNHSSPDVDTDSDSNWDNVNTLFASVDQLSSVGPPVNDSDREVNSDAPSPQEASAEKPDNHVELINSKTTLFLDWDPEIFNSFFKDLEHQAWENLNSIPNPELAENKRQLALQQKSTVSLYDCFRNFSTPEVLGDQDLWYCPRCKEHRRATKTIQIWSTGDLLTIHLKRFQSARSFSDKISMVVDFPIEGLDMSEFVMSSEANNQDLIYDLVAVDNHYGGLGGGHYTASAMNFRDNKWYYFNDGRVTPIDDPKECITGAAYLLFYKKRSSTRFAGGDSVRELLNQGRAAFEAKLTSLKDSSLQVRGEIDEFNKQQAEIADASKKKEESSNSDDDDLYGDSESKAESNISTSEIPQPKATKK